MSRVQIPVSQVEFVEGGHTIWVHNAEGATVMRIKLPIAIRATQKCENVCSHFDLTVDGDKLRLGTIPPTFCLSDDAARE